MIGKTRGILGYLIASVMLCGCAVRVDNRHGKTGSAGLVPNGAHVVADGELPLSFFFTRPAGTVYVYDRTSDTLVHTAELPTDAVSGIIVAIDPTKRALVARSAMQAEGEHAQELVLAQPINPKHRFTMWFAPRRESEASSTRPSQ